MAPQVRSDAAEKRNTRRRATRRRVLHHFDDILHCQNSLTTDGLMTPESLTLPTPAQAPRSATLLLTPGQQPSITFPEDSRLADSLITSRYAVERSRWVEALAADVSMHTLQCRLESCGRNAWVERCNETGQLRIVADGCKQRFCPRCSRIFSRRCKDRLKAWTSSLDPNHSSRLKMLTLTMQHSTAPLKTQLKHLRQSFRRLRQRSLFKRKVTSGIGVIQITYNAASDQWHPHLHVLCYGDYIPVGPLTQAWRHASHGSTQIDIRAVRDQEKCVDYVTRYIAKPINFDDSPPPERLREFVQTLKGARMLIAFGDVPKQPKPEIPETNWTYVDSVAGLIRRARMADERALTILAALDRTPDSNADDNEDTLFSSLPLDTC